MNTDELLNIMLNMDFMTLSNFCQVNIWASQICNSNSFWLDKLQVNYPHTFATYNILSTQSQYAPDVTNYMSNNAKKFYKSTEDFYQCVDTNENNIFDVISFAYILSAPDIIESDTFINMLLLIYTDI